MSIPRARPEIVPQQALDEPSLANNAPSIDLSSFGPTIPVATHVSLVQGTKRKASDMDDAGPPQGASQTCPPIKQEPGSPHCFDYRGSDMRDTHSEIYEISTGYASSSRGDDTEDQMLDIPENDGTTTMGLSGASLGTEGRLHMSSRDMFVPLKQEVETQTARVVLPKNNGGTNGLLPPLPILDDFPPPYQQKASSRPEGPRRCTQNKLGDVAYDSIPDYSPPISTLPRGNPHVLQVAWRQEAFIDLSKDPDQHMLHEAELKLATTLNLSCAKYLCTKRRIFQARFEALQAGRVFKKTTYEKACKINTNKASKICNAFEKVGWFDEKYFLEYLDKSNNPLRKIHNGSKDRRSLSSELTEPDIWDVSESEFHFTSEEDEESTGDNTADSSVSFDSKYKETETVQSHGTLCGNETVDESPTIEGRRPRRRLMSQETMYPANSGSLFEDSIEETPLLETRSRTQKIKLALNSRSGDSSDRVSIIEANNDQQDNVSRRSAPTNLPHSLDKANAADIMLVNMKDKGRPCFEIEEAWERKTGKAQTPKTLSSRYARIMANLACTELKPEEARDSGCSLTVRRLEPNDNKLLLAAEAEIEENFQREKADIVTEIDSNFQSEKWTLVAEAMSRSGSTHYPAQLVQAQYKSLTKVPERADAEFEENEKLLTNLRRRTTRTIRDSKTRTSTPSRSGVERVEGAERGSKTTSKNKSQYCAEQSARMRSVWAIRRALGTNGRHGGPPKASKIAKKAKMAIPCAAPNAGIPLGPTVTYQSGHSSDSLPNQTQPFGVGKEVRREANQKKQFLEQIIPTTSQVDTSAIHIKPSQKGSMQKNRRGVVAGQTQHGSKRHTCRKCGMNYANSASHYRVFPNIGSEHRRRMAANNAAAESHSRPAITDVGVGSTSDITMGQMVFDTPSREQSRELLMSREDRELLGEVID